MLSKTFGHWRPGESAFFDASSPREQTSLARQGACAEVAGVFLDAEGTVMKTSLNERMIAIDGQQLRAVDQVIAIPYGTSKQPAVRAALHSGLVSAVVTHRSLAEALLEEDAPGAGTGPS